MNELNIQNCLSSKLNKRYYTFIFLLLCYCSIIVDVRAETPSASEVNETIKFSKKQELVRTSSAEIDTIDPHTMEGTEAAHFVRDLFEGLTNQDEFGRVIPAGATHWELIDKKTYHFHLLRNAKWSNGESITANDYVYGFQRLIDPKIKSPYSWLMEKASIVNASAIIKGTKPPKSLGVKAINDYLLEIKLEKNVPYFLQITTNPALVPLHKKSIDRYGDQWTQVDNLVNNGAFILSFWDKNRVDMVPNPYYRGIEQVKLTKVTYHVIKDQLAEMKSFLNGNIDITTNVPNEYIKKLREFHASEYTVSPNLCTYFYEMNNKKAPFNDVRVRKAINLSIDRERIISEILNNRGDFPAYNFTHQRSSGLKVNLPSDALMTQEQRNSKARSLFLEAGFSKENPLKFTLMFNTSDNHRKIAQAIVKMIQKHIDIEVVLVEQDWNQFVNNLQQGNYDVARYGWCSDYNEASSFLSLWTSEHKLNNVFYYNPSYDLLIDKASNAEDEQERAEFYRKAESFLSRDVPFAPIFHYVKVRLINKKLKGFPINNPEEMIYSKDLYFIE